MDANKGLVNVNVAGDGEKKVSGSPLVVQRVVRESGGSWPMLNRMNYADWALLMQVMLEARQLLVAVNDGTRCARRTARLWSAC